MRGLLGHVLGAGVVEEPAGSDDRSHGVGGSQGEDGTIGEILVAEGQAVESGQTVATIL